MASFSAELRVAGHVFPIQHCTYEATQATDTRGRVVSKVRRTSAEFVFDVPDGSFLVDWANNPAKRLPAESVFFDEQRRPIETLSFGAAYCVGYQEFFASGDAAGGAYQCRVTLSDPDGWHWRPGGPRPPRRRSCKIRLGSPSRPRPRCCPRVTPPLPYFLGHLCPMANLPTLAGLAKHSYRLAFPAWILPTKTFCLLAPRRALGWPRRSC
ncbi:hypothetical protein IC235_02315 [Hymenobacter sp. BT664]|uniref:Uncharacterized protein n=1 Tax=Hymenobacter montanus TaxID=2771359 RepID=A0A927BB00_9BACT|nr:type VI secretion system tube protein TssD [Hymenobacter montanus]MBD2766723.1 hypothetical protein [Hymenobacter montanus]